MLWEEGWAVVGEQGKEGEPGEPEEPPSPSMPIPCRATEPEDRRRPRVEKTVWKGQRKNSDQIMGHMFTIQKKTGKNRAWNLGNELNGDPV